MKITYWVAACLNDNECYSIRRKTKKEVVEALKGVCGRFGPPTKAEVEYGSGFDLLEMCMGEGRGWWEAEARYAAWEQENPDPKGATR